MLSTCAIVAPDNDRKAIFIEFYWIAVNFPVQLSRCRSVEHCDGNDGDREDDGRDTTATIRPRVL